MQLASNHNEALEKEDKRTAFGLQGKESEYICKKYAEEALNKRRSSNYIFPRKG